MPNNFGNDNEVRCSFCGKPQSQAKRLISGNGVYICDECVELCMDIIADEVNNFAYRLQSQGLNLETYLKYTGMDVNAIKEQFRPQSEKQFKLRLALEKIAELENLEVSDEAVEEEYEKLAKQYNMEVAQIKNLVAETQIRADLKNQKAIDFVKENASVKAEKPAKKTTRRKSTKKAAEEKTEETAEAKTEE